MDDQDVDRYIVKRRLSRSEGFGEVMEAPTGDDFLKDFFNGDGSKKVASLPLLVLMDINMPGRNGFETVEELQKRMAEGRGPESVVIMMFTTSDNPADRERALQLDSVKGYIVKPLDDDGIQRIRDLYYS
ncbi:MAG: response regulator [Pseudomonadota bacterium]